MEFKEAIKIKQRMCWKYMHIHSCEINCPLFDICTGTCRFDYEDYEETEQILTHWNKAKQGDRNNEISNNKV